MTASHRKLTWAAAVFLVVYFLFFTRKGLVFPFDNDDMYSIYMGWTKPWGDILSGLIKFWQPSFRPAGLLLYRALFEIFGFDPLPFRIVCLLITLGNVALCFWFVRLVAMEDRIAALATLFFAFHSRLMEVWFRTAIIYDVLCFTFFYLGLCLYIAARRKNGQLSPARVVTVLLCFLLAMDSKEMAVAFPVVLLCWEFFFHGVTLKIRRNLVISVTAIMAAAFILTKTHGGAASMADPSFQPAYTLQRFEQNWNGMLTHIFLLTKELQGVICILILSGLLAVAAALKNRVLLFAWTILFFAAMPVVFIPPRGGYVLYIPYPGWCLFAATLLVQGQDSLLRIWPALRFRLAMFVFVLVAWRWGKANLHDQRIDPQKDWLYASPRAITNLIDQVAAKHTFAPGSSILFLDDGFQTDEWTPVFALRLYYLDPTLVVDRVKMMNGAPADWSNYRTVFAYQAGEYVQRQP